MTGIENTRVRGADGREHSLVGSFRSLALSCLQPTAAVRAYQNLNLITGAAGGLTLGGLVAQVGWDTFLVDSACILIAVT
jgi:hypothetical protein